ncbi:MAG: tRNA (uridine(54)-C5)-methyltransferase TrmA [Glaciecola sp.]
MSYDDQLTYKQDKLNLLLSPFFSDELSVFSSPETHYRMRAEFRVWHEGDDTFHIMFNQHTKEKYRVDQLPAASILINEAMQCVIQQVTARPELRTKLFQIDYLSSTSNELVISMLYHRQLEQAWLNEAEALQQYLVDALATKLGTLCVVNIIGRARKLKHVLGADYVNETLTIDNKAYVFKQIENSFTQPNAKINVDMIEWVIQNAAEPKSDLLELYCGAGNFSVPLSDCFNAVLATEISKTSVNAAQDNIRNNHVDNLHIARLSSEEFVEAYVEGRKFNRLANIDLSAYNFTTVLVDPPRAGIDDNTLALMARFETIIYISCNPNTLVDNLHVLAKTHEVKQAALFDQFPFTEHMESGVILQRKSQ